MTLVMLYNDSHGLDNYLVFILEDITQNILDRASHIFLIVDIFWNSGNVSICCERKRELRRMNKTKKVLHRYRCEDVSQWSGTAKNRDVSTGPFTSPFAHSLAPLTVRLLLNARFTSALCYAHSFARSLTSLTPSLVGKCIFLCLNFTLFWPIVCSSANVKTDKKKKK